MTTISDRTDKWAWQKAMMASDLALTTKALLHTLCAHMNGDGGSCYPSMETVAREMTVHRATAHRALGDAVRSGWLVVESKGGVAPGRGGAGKTNRYTATIPAADQLSHPRDSSEADQLSHPARPTVASEPTNCRTHATQDTRETPEETPLPPRPMTSDAMASSPGTTREGRRPSRVFLIAAGQACRRLSGGRLINRPGH